MIASVLLAAVLTQPVLVQPASAKLGVSLRIVEPCDTAVAASPECTPADYDQWLQKHSKREMLTTENGERILQIVF